MRRAQKKIPALTATCVLLMLAGCASPGFFKLSKGRFPKTGLKNPVRRILGMWEPAEGMAFGKSCRGFSGQILFFSQNSNLPAQVDGDVRIYVFDDQGTPEEQAVPIHEFEYPAATWNAFLFNGSLGATYSVFVPYTRPGVHEAKCSLRIRYTPKAGLPAYSDMVNVVLPGIKKIKEEGQPVAMPSEKRPAGSDPQPGDVTGRDAPRARGASTPLPTLQEIQEQLHAKRPRAVELNAQERRRIMREAVARVEASDRPKIELTGYDEDEPERAAADERTPQRIPARDLPEDDDDFFEDNETKRAIEPVDKSRIPESDAGLDEASDGSASDSQSSSLP
jgi:hypothetical protein